MTFSFGRNYRGQAGQYMMNDLTDRLAPDFQIEAFDLCSSKSLAFSNL